MSTRTATKIVAASLFYLAAIVGANPVFANGLKPVLEPLRSGDMRKLVVHSAPKDLRATAFTDEGGAEHDLTDDLGKVLLVNFWATWCAPCREEMPELNALQHEMGGEDFKVIAIATGRNSLAGIKKFYAEEEIDALPIFLDGRSTLARATGVLGLPVTIILDQDGREVARLQGGAKWDSESAKSILKTVIDQGAAS
mgnify:CR=1 FL=1